MKPATRLAIDRAVEIILKSINEENAVELDGFNGEQDPIRPPTAAQLDTHASALQASLEILTSNLTRRIASHLRERNALSSAMARLPTEVFVRIMDLAIKAPVIQCLSCIYNLRRVCSRWSDIIEHTPAFWARIVFDCTVSILLEKSKDALLSIDCEAERFGSPQPPISFIRKVGQHYHRWRAANFTVSRDDSAVIEELSTVLQSPAPQIRYFKLYMPDIRPPPPVPFIDLFSGTANHLIDLHLDGVNIPWSSDILTGLESLSIAHSRDHTQNPTIQQILHILQRSPNLRHLRVGYADSSPAKHVVAADFEPVILPSLVHARFTFYSPSVMHAFISHIYAPTCTALQTYCQNSGSSTITTPIFHHFPALLPLIVDNGLRLLLADVALQLVPRDLYNRAVDITFGQGDLHGLLDQVRAAGSIMHTIPMHLGLLECSPLEEVISSVMSFKGMASIVVTGATIGADPVIAALSQPVLQDGVVQWPYPRLTDLEIQNSPYDESLLVRMVEARYGRSAGAVGGLEDVESSLKQPLPFDTIRVPSVTTSTLHLVEAIIGIGRLIAKRQLDDPPLGLDEGIEVNQVE